MSAKYNPVRSRYLAPLVLVWVLMGAGSDSILAAAASDVGRDVEKEANEEAKVDILSPRFDLGIWTVVVFVLLLLVLSKYAWGPMLEGLQKREANIRSALDEAQKAREEAKGLRDRFEAEINKAAANAREIIEEARRDAIRLAEEERAKAKAEIQAERDRLYRDMATAKDQALQEMWQQSARLATMISSRALRREVNADDHRALLDDALNDMRAAAGERQDFTSGKA